MMKTATAMMSNFHAASCKNPCAGPTSMAAQALRPLGPNGKSAGTPVDDGPDNKA